jgi:hypothetical protein
MGKICAILGVSGSGKSTSMIVNPDGSYDFSAKGYNGMNPDTHIIFNLDRKELPFPAGMWGPDKGNYIETSDMAEIRAAMQEIAKMEHIKSISLDTINLFLAYKEFNDRKKPDFDKWREISLDLQEINMMCNTVLRADQVAYIMGHVELITDIDGSEKMVMAVTGKKSRKLMPEGYYPIVIMAMKESTPTGKPKYIFSTEGINTSAKTPIGMFSETIIPNSLKLIDDTIRAYYKI